MSKKIIVIIAGVVLIFSAGILFYGLKNKDISSTDKICLNQGGNTQILNAVKTKYPGSKIVKVFDSFSQADGPFWKLEIKTAEGNIATEIMHCQGNYFTEDCKENDACYTDVAFFYKDVSICKKIIDKHTRNNCYALLAGLSPTQWNKSVCEKLSDTEAKSGCINFFNEK